MYAFVGNAPVNNVDPDGLEPYDVNGRRTLLGISRQTGGGFDERGQYSYFGPDGRQWVPCVVCHGRNADGMLPGLTLTDSFVGGRWYHSGSSGRILGNQASGVAEGLTNALGSVVAAVGNMSVAAGRLVASPITGADADDVVVDLPFDEARVGKVVGDWVFPDREADSLISMSGRFGGGLMALPVAKGMATGSATIARSLQSGARAAVVNLSVGSARLPVPLGAAEGIEGLAGLKNVRNWSPALSQTTADACGLYAAGTVLDALAAARMATVLDNVANSHVYARMAANGGRGLNTAELTDLLNNNLGDNAIAILQRDVKTSQLSNLLSRNGGSQLIAHVDGNHYVRVLGTIEDGGTQWVRVYDPARGVYEQTIHSFMTRTGPGNQMVHVIPPKR